MNPAHEAGPGSLAAHIASKSLLKAFQDKAHPNPYLNRTGFRGGLLA